MLVGGVRASSDRSEAVESRREQTGGVAVRPASRRGLVNLEPELVSPSLRQSPKAPIAWRSLERRTTNRAFDQHLGARRLRAKRMDRLLDAIGILSCRHPNIDRSLALRRHHVGAEPAVDRANIHRNALGRIVQCKELLNDV